MELVDGGCVPQNIHLLIILLEINIKSQRQEDDNHGFLYNLLQ